VVLLEWCEFATTGGVAGFRLIGGTMETVTTTLIGVGGLICIMSLILGIVEISTLKLIRPPQQKTFSYIRLAATQYQTIFVPALGALVSGLFVSLAASFFYLGLTAEKQESWPQWVGSGMFIAGAISLTVTLRAAFKGVGEPGELARDPFTIRAAANEYAADPRRGTLDPTFLNERLSEWVTYISTRAMNISSTRVMNESSKMRSDRLGGVLDKGSKVDEFWRGIRSSICVYFVALSRFPFRFMWPLLGPLVLAAGVALYMLTESKLDVGSSIRPYFGASVLMALALVLTLIYCAARGNRARLWHRVNLTAVEDASKSISAAQLAHGAIKLDDARIERVLQSADVFLKRQSLATEVRPEINPATELQPDRALVLGALRVSITWRSIPKAGRE
jgi:hypothetical protein